MPKMMAYCGMDCGECPAYMATQTKNEAMKSQVAGFMNQKLGAKYTSKDINCDGCTINKNLVPHCKACEVRLSAMQRKVASCAVCKDYGCAKLTKLYTMIPPTAKQNLEAIRNQKKS
jgi:hypothetical protein